MSRRFKLGAGILAAALMIPAAACQRNADPEPSKAQDEANLLTATNESTAGPSTQSPDRSGFAAMDADGDGKLTAAEHSAAAAAMFGMMDGDSDSMVTTAEMDAAQASLGGSANLSSADKIKAVDGNGDGTLSKDEHVRGSQAMFAKMDKDSNDSLSEEEFDAVHKAMLGR